jgi:uncharacterized repeat protein (TIGR01451 family)
MKRIPSVPHLVLILSLCLASISKAAAPLAVSIMEPVAGRDHSLVIPAQSVQISGVVSGAGQIKSVLWKSSRGFSDLAHIQTWKNDAGDIQWNTRSPIPLLPGANHIDVLATDNQGRGAQASINIVSTANLSASDSRPAAPEIRSSFYHGRPVTYQVTDGLAIYEGDIVLGTAAELEAARMSVTRTPVHHGPNPEAAVIAYQSGPGGRWPIVSGVGRVPYTISARDQAVPSAVANINSAVTQFNTQLSGVIQFVPATPSDTNYAEFDLDPSNQNGVCEANVGYVGNGAQFIGGSILCTVPTLLHEMGHEIGLWHEQSRNDRNTYVQFLEPNIDKPQITNFSQLTDNEVDAGLYNYASLMHYYPFAFSRDGVSPTLESIPAGIPLSSPLPEYTSGDVDGITRLYGGAPVAVTIDTNPSGLNVIVDGVTVTAPQSYDWPMGSQHTLAVPGGAQALSSAYYIFGRWNVASTDSTQTITVAAGDGSPLSPSRSPAITAYLASFIPIHLYNPTVSPAAAGTVSVTPAPSSISINGTPTNYFEDRQLITLTAAPAAGHNFYFWYNAALFNWYSATYTFFDQADLSALGALFVTGPLTTVNATSPDFGATGSFPGFLAVVDGTANALPRNWSPAEDGSSWAVNTTHTVCGTPLVGGACPSSAPSQSPVTTNITYAFSKWTGSAGTVTSNALSFTVSGHKTFTENHVPSFRWIVLPSPGTASCDSVSPSANNLYLDQFFTRLTPVTISANASTGSAFVGWSQDLTGTANPRSITVTNQLYATANFNAAGATAPLSITGFAPVNVLASATAAPKITIKGKGFVNNGSVYVYFNGNFRTSTYIAATPQHPAELQVQLQAGDVAKPGYSSIYVLNDVPGGCGAYVQKPFDVRAHPGKPLLKITKTHTGNFTHGQVGATYTLSVANKGGASTDASTVTVTDTVPSGLTLTSMSGSGWTCAAGGDTCTRNDVLNAGLSYPAITVTVNVSTTASSPQVNQASVSGGGSVSASVQNSTIINP